jgi:soluble cytochrome b562
MAVSGISTSLPINGYQPSVQQQFQQQLTQLVKSLQSGDLSGAQQAYAALTQLQSNGSAPSSQNDPLSQALNKIGQALQSGDLTKAQQALAALQQLAQQAKGARRHHHHHHAANSASTTTSPSSSSGPTDSASSTSVGTSTSIIA